MSVSKSGNCCVWKRLAAVSSGACSVCGLRVGGPRAPLVSTRQFPACTPCVGFVRFWYFFVLEPLQMEVSGNGLPAARCWRVGLRLHFALHVHRAALLGSLVPAPVLGDFHVDAHAVCRPGPALLPAPLPTIGLHFLSLPCHTGQPDGGGKALPCSVSVRDSSVPRCALRCQPGAFGHALSA